MKTPQKIYVVPGFHVNYNHSYRGDRHDESGFGYDTEVIRAIVTALNRANDRGLSAAGTWDFDNFWSIQNCMTRFCPDLLDAISLRVKDGSDEVIIDNWNNGGAAWMTREELRLSMQRAITNPWGSGVADVFGSYTPVIRSQETMFTHGSIPIFKELGLKAICMYYSAVPFDSLRNFVPALSPNKRYNPLTLRCPVSGEDFLVIPMYNQGDILDNGSLEAWLRKIRRHQESGDISGNALLYINMDADAKVWTGIDIPGIPALLQKHFINRIPNFGGINEVIEVVNRLEFAEFGALGDYIRENPPAGDIRIDLDTADGSHTGFNSWTEKWINYSLWTLHQQARRFERAAAALMRDPAISVERKAEARRLLYADDISAMECRLLTNSTTHFGLAGPLINTGRLKVAFRFAFDAREKSRKAAETLLSPAQPKTSNPDEFMRFTLIDFNKYDNAPHTPGTQSLVEVGLGKKGGDFNPGDYKLIDENGNEFPFDFNDSGFHLFGNKSMMFLHTTTDKCKTTFSLVKSPRAQTRDLVQIKSNLLTNGLITVRLDDNGFVNSLQYRGHEYAAAPFFSPGITYKIDNHDIYFGADRFKCVIPNQPAGGNGFFRSLFFVTDSSSTKMFTSFFSLSLFEGLPYLYIDGFMKLEKTECHDSALGMASRIPEHFDARWREVMPLNISPGFTNLPGKYLKVWKHNYLNVTHPYELNFGAIDARNRNISAFNNHVTDGWVAVSNGKQGLLLAFEQTFCSSPAVCPMRLSEQAGRQRLTLNPFGTYHGPQLSHLPDGSGAARDFSIAAVPHLDSMAPSYNGQTIRFRIILAPYQGDAPPAQIQRDALAFSMPPLSLYRTQTQIKNGDQSPFVYIGFEDEYELKKTAGWTYTDFIEHANAQPPAPQVSGRHALPAIPLPLLGKMARDFLEAQFRKK